MNENKEEVVEYYERKIRNGFPSGEVESELLQKGYSKEEVADILDGMREYSREKNREREKNFRFVLGSVFIIGGLFFLLFGKTGIGTVFLISGSVKIIYDVILAKKPDQI